ncbi:MAG TPA: UDP-N-acetylmuramate--L-alanine ligase, partial [Anaerolineae bacterium]
GAPAPKAAAGWQQLLNLPVGVRAAVHIHLLGIGGSGLSAIAVVLLEQGYTVSGSDQVANEATSDLAGRGAKIAIGHDAANVAGADLVLISSAVPPTNPEIVAAAAADIPVVKRADFLGALMAGQAGVGVAGTHGKTTTTAMLALTLWRGGVDPSFIVGGRLAELGLMGSAARSGSGPFVIEADEYDRMFLGLPLQTAIVTNVEWDHVDCYPTPEAFAQAFRQFAGQLPSGGALLVCADDPGALALRGAAGPGVSVVTYGLAEGADWQARDLTPNAEGGLTATIDSQGRAVTQLSLAVPGVHNMRNALAVLAAAERLGVEPDATAAILSTYHGVGRRFEVVGEASGVTVIDDYGHHPTEIATTLAAARSRYSDRRIWAVFQPHTYSRFRTLLDGFTHSFGDADEVVLLDIYAAREREDPQVHARQLLARLEHPAAHYLGSIASAAAYLQERVTPGDVVITLSAGDGNRVGQILLAGLRARPAGKPGHEVLPVTPEGGRAGDQSSAIAELTAEASALGVTLIAGEPLARHTTFRIGGPADVYARAGTAEQLAGLAVLAHRHALPCTVIGGGSNILVSDQGIRGLVIANAARGVSVENLAALPGGQPQIVADSGLPLAGLARWAMREGWTGLEWAVSVPGTVGGAVIGNAGAHGSELAEHLTWVMVAWPDGRRDTWLPADLHFAYRSSRLKQALAAGQPAPVVLRVGFALQRGEPATMTARADDFLARRRITQPMEPSAGSIFRNPPGDFSGRLIEAAGLKGHRIGAAQVSPQHANFIVNRGDARATDVAALMVLIESHVRDQFGVQLVPEILFLGEWPTSNAMPVVESPGVDWK